jgi:hypothetical protein
MGISALFAQDSGEKNSSFAIGVHSYYGFILKHTESIGHLAESHPYGFELNFNQITTGTKDWHQLYKYPEVGYAIGMFDFRNKTLGKALYAITYLDKPLLKSEKSALRLKIGTGLVGASNPYNPETNFQNTALSGRIMYAMQGECAWAYNLSGHWQIRSAVTLTHFSNGGLKLPNSGINIPALKIGVNYIPNPPHFQSVTDTVSKNYYNSLSVNLSGAFFLKEVKLPGGKKYPGAALSMYVNKRLNRKSALNIGVDGFYNTAIKYVISRDPDVDTLNTPDFKRAGLTFGHELFISRVSMLTQLGVYVYNPYQKIDTMIYQRYGLKYYFNSRLFAGVMLKTHFGSADCMEWTMGISW